MQIHHGGIAEKGRRGFLKANGESTPPFLIAKAGTMCSAQSKPVRKRKRKIEYLCHSCSTRMTDTCQMDICESCLSLKKMEKAAKESRAIASFAIARGTVKMSTRLHGVYRGKKYTVYDIDAVHKVNAPQKRCVQDTIHAVKVDFNYVEPVTNTIAIYCLDKKTFLICDFDGIKRVLSREEEVELCKTFGPMHEVKRAGGAAGRFTRASLNYTSCLRTDNCADGHIEWKANVGEKSLRTCPYVYTNKQHEEKRWLGASPAMLGRRLKTAAVQNLFLSSSIFKKLKLKEMERRANVEGLMAYLGLCWFGRDCPPSNPLPPPGLLEKYCTSTGETHNGCFIYPHLDGNTTRGIEIMTTWRRLSRYSDRPTFFPLLKLAVTCRANRDIFFSNLIEDFRLLHFSNRGRSTAWSRLWGPLIM